jgi:putative FmdB family regulatory protein
MPIYEYLCDDCGERYERIVLSKGTVIECPKCASAKQTMQISVFAAHGNGAKSSGGPSGSSSGSSSGGGCCGGACGCR